MLIVCEGEKTEPQYLREIQRQHRLATAHVQVLACADGSAPMQVVEYAARLFHDGDQAKRIEAGAFDRIAVVFDRDSHASYHDALGKAQALHDSGLRNDERRRVPFCVVASVPCFELWLLLHFEDVLAPLSRQDAVQRLKQHLPDYQKGQGGHWAATQSRCGEATARTGRLAASTCADDGDQPFTAMHDLVARLRSLKD